MDSIQSVCLSSLEKVFPDALPQAPEWTRDTALRGEVYSLQWALRASAATWVRVDVDSDLPVEVRAVVPVPVDVPRLTDDPHMLRTTPGLYPDCLRAPDDGHWRLPPGQQWTSFWITVRVPVDARPGAHVLTLRVEDRGETRSGKETPSILETPFSLDVLPAQLAPAGLLRYEWLHADCLHAYYRVPCWSEEHWRIIDAFVGNGARHGLNVLQIPLWTPPLDTAVGHVRPKTQLLGVEKKGEDYDFDFTRVERYLELARRHRMERVAMMHLFTQWGARATPTIYGRENGGPERALFGWDVPANAPGYAAFLTQLMPALREVLQRTGWEDRVFFSVSDEPSETHLESYRYAVNLFRQTAPWAKTLEALSTFEFYRHGLVDHPVPANNWIDYFHGKVKGGLWTYYCVSQGDLVPNRFMAMPLARVRVMGVLLYLYDVVGFLQWAFNFYHTHLSFQSVNPYADTSAGRWVPSGDAFIVYPGADGRPEDSMRHEVFFEAIQDLAALRMLEAEEGRDAVERLIHEGVDYRLSMKRYPRDASWLLSLRRRVNERLRARHDESTV